jgi:C4-dicarboxylate-binding protein DctP
MRRSVSLILAGAVLAWSGAELVESWAADIEARSGGAIDVQTFPANQAFKPKENFPAVARGKIEAALSVNFQWGKGSTVAEYLQGKLEAKGVHNIAWLFTTRMSAYTSKGKALIKPADFQGVKIRGLNKLVDSGLEALGAAPSAMSGSQVYQALQTGVIDAGLTDISAAYSRKYYEVQDHVTVSPLFSVYFHIYVNQDWWKRAAITEASTKAEADALILTEESAGKAPGQLTEKGMKVHIHTADEIAAMKAGNHGPALHQGVSGSLRRRRPETAGHDLGHVGPGLIPSLDDKDPSHRDPWLAR